MSEQTVIRAIERRRGSYRLDLACGHSIVRRNTPAAVACPICERKQRHGEREPLPPRKLNIRPNAPLDNRPSFNPARNGRR